MYKWFKETVKLRFPLVYRLLVSIVNLLTRIKEPLKMVRAVFIDMPPIFLWLLFKRPAVQSQANNLIVVLVNSEVWRDGRVERGARRLAAAGFRVKLIYPDWFSALGVPPIDWGKGVEFTPVAGHNWEYIVRFPYLFNYALFSAACRERPFAIHAHDLSTCLIGLAAARKLGAYCVCDFHEWYSENVSWDNDTASYIPHPPVKAWVYRQAERYIMRNADEVITVCGSLAADMNDSLLPGRPGRTVHLVRNIPSIAATSSDSVHPQSIAALRRQRGNPDMFWLLYQGGVGPSRLLEPIIEALQYLPSVMFVIRGPFIDTYGPEYEKLAREKGVDDRLICLPPVAAADVVPAAMGADAGIWSLPNLCKNFYNALPNKVFEYLAAGLPVVAAHYPEVQKIVDGYAVGRCFDPYDPRSIAAAIGDLQSDRDLQRKCRDNIAYALSNLRASQEWDKLAELYLGLKRAG